MFGRVPVPILESNTLFAHFLTSTIIIIIFEYVIYLSIIFCVVVFLFAFHSSPSISKTTRFICSQLEKPFHACAAFARSLSIYFYLYSIM